MIKLLKSFALILLTFPFLLSCNQSESYLFTEQSTLRMIERQDHQKCISQGLDYGDWDDMITELYWRCRYNLVRQRVINDATDPQSIRNNAVIEKITVEIVKNLNRAKYANLAKIDDDIELSDHNICAKMGYDLNSSSQRKVDGYYRCRQNLILGRIPPTTKITDSFEDDILPPEKSQKFLALVKESRREAEANAKIAVELMQKYPNCAGLNTNSDDFKKCSSATDESKKCLASIESMRIKKQLADKIYCQKQSYTQFPDNYALAKDKSASEIAKLEKQQKDESKNATLQFLEGNPDYKNIGRQVEDSGDKEEESKDKLYNRIELLRLREQFILQCNKTMDDKLPEFADKTAQDCLNVAKNWDR